MRREPECVRGVHRRLIVIVLARQRAILVREQALLAEPGARFELFEVARRPASRAPDGSGRPPVVGEHVVPDDQATAHNEDELLQDLAVLNDDVAWQALHPRVRPRQLCHKCPLGVAEEGETKDHITEQLEGQLPLQGGRQFAENLLTQHLLLDVDSVPQVALDVAPELSGNLPPRHEAAHLRHVSLGLVVEDASGEVRDHGHHGAIEDHSDQHGQDGIGSRHRALRHHISISDRRDGHEGPIQVAHIHAPPRIVPRGLNDVLEPMH
mmetsp:Transcript_29449/g.73955  ORF Transcript_29449/g.73955 Transcript_29449/m.73955 type:complete len:267 (+) Transcript_29449:432-1232(+)